MSPVDEPKKIEVRVRRVAARGSFATSEASVACPAHEHPVSLEQCRGCSRLEALHLHSGRPTVECRPAVSPVESPGLVWPYDARAVLGSELHHTPVAAVMTTDVTCVAPSLPLLELEALMIDLGFSGLPVVDPDGRPVGMVSKTDLVRELYEASLSDEDPPPETVADVMSERPISVRELTPLGEAAAVMAYEGLHRLPVVDGDGKVVGVLSALDVARWVATRAGYAVPHGGVR